jgi:peroxiredoxin
LPRWQSAIHDHYEHRSIQYSRKKKTMNQTIGKQFPDFEMVDHDSQPVKLSQYAGKFPLILSFYRGYW